MRKAKKPNKNEAVAESLMEAADLAKAHSPVGNKDQGDYFKLKQPSPLADRLSTLKARVGYKDDSDYADLKKATEGRFKKLRDKLSKKK